MLIKHHLWQVAKYTVASREVLIEGLFGRLSTYTKVPQICAVMDVLAKIVAEVLSILAITTKGMKERRASGSIFFDKLFVAKL